MANCNLCGLEVEAHRYIRAEPMYLDAKGRLQPIPKEHASGFYHLSHPLGEIEEHIAINYPPSPELATRLLWSPAPGATIPDLPPEVANVINQRMSRNGFFGVRTVIVMDRASLHQVMPLLVPDGTVWYIPHAGAVNPVEAARILMESLAETDPMREQLAALIARG